MQNDPAGLRVFDQTIIDNGSFDNAPSSVEGVLPRGVYLLK